MARLSGLPSEHHHEGPGDAPRRKRGRPSKTQFQADDMVSAGKRTASPTAEFSQTKRTKRAHTDNDDDQIAEQVEQSISRSQEGDTIHVQTQNTTSSTTRRNTRRQSEPLVTRTEQDDDDDDVTYPTLPSTQPVSGLTPHLDRVGAARTRFTNNRRSRMSMPAQLHIERVDEVEEEAESPQIQYAPLTAVLDSRTRRRLRRSHLSQEVNEFEDHQKQEKKMLLELRKQLKARDERIRELEYSLEARRLGDIDITDEHAEALEQELEQARNEIDELRASSLYNGHDHDITPLSEDEDNELLLVDPGELHMSQDLDLEYTPDTKYASRVRELSSQVTFESFPRISQLSHDTLLEDDAPITPTIQDQAVVRYERELQHYTKQLGQAQGALRVLTIELQNLNFLDAGSQTEEILTQMRHGFDTLRAEIEKFFPDTTTGLTGQELLAKVPELFGGILVELKEKITQLSKIQKTEVLLRRQFEGVLDLLGASDERNKQLDTDVYNLDKANEEKQRTILDLEERNNTLTVLNNEQNERLEENDAQIAGLQDECKDKDTGLERLREALEKYREDLDTVTQTATAFEESHYDQIARMEQEHAEAIAGLEAERLAEEEGREAAEADAQQKSEYINELEDRIAGMEADVEAITADLQTLQTRLEEQRQAREAAETDRDENAELAYERANIIENLNETVAGLNEQIESFRTTLQTERAQRERTESDLDEANDKIQDLQDRLRDSHMQCQELRNKMFEVQQEREATVAQMQQDAEEREDDLNDQLETEIQLRIGAEQKVEGLQQETVDLQAALATVEADLVAMTEARNELEQDRDVQVANLAGQLAELKKKYTALENSTNSTITSLQAQITDLNNQVQRQQAEIKRLNDQVAEQDRVYLEDTTVLKVKISDLEHDLAAEKEDNEAYRKENASLTDRVTNEANEMLKIQDSHHNQVTALQEALGTQDATIKNLQAINAQRQVEYEEALEEKSRELTELQLMGDARAETILILEASIEDIKAKFRAAEEDNRVTIDSMLIRQRQLQDQNEELAAALKKRNAEALAAIEEMRVKRVEIKTKGVDLNRVVGGKVVKTSEKLKIGKKGKKKVTKRQWDSGFGVDENIEDGEDLNGEEPLAV